MVGNFDRLLNPVSKVLDLLQPLLRKTIKSLRFVIIFHRKVNQTWFFLINVTLYAPLRCPVNYLHYKVGNGVDKNSRETSRSPRVAANESRDPEGERGPSARPSSPLPSFGLTTAIRISTLLFSSEWPTRPPKLNSLKNRRQSSRSVARIGGWIFLIAPLSLYSSSEPIIYLSAL